MDKTDNSPSAAETAAPELNPQSRIPAPDETESTAECADNAADSTAPPENTESAPESSDTTSECADDEAEKSESGKNALIPAAQAEAQYKVAVTHYAHYDKNIPGYPSSVERQIEYAARAPFSRFFLDFFTILFRPSSFWKGQDSHPATLGQLHFPHLFVLVLLRTAAVFAGNIMRPDAELFSALIAAAAQGALIFVLVWILALITSGITAITGGGLSFDRALRFIGFGITPLLFVGLIGVVPIPYVATVCDLLAMPWAFAVMGCGVLPFLRIKPDHAPLTASIFCGLLLFMWGALPIFIPYLFKFIG